MHDTIRRFYGRALACLTLCLGLTLNAADVPLVWDWHPNPAMLSGLSTNDYLTNITFRLYTSTNITVPLPAWTVVTNIPGTNRQITVTVDRPAQWFILRTVTVGGQSDPSNAALWLGPEGSGVLGILRAQ